MKDFKKLNARLEKLEADKADKLEQTKSKLNKAKSKLQAATEDMAKAYADENETAYADAAKRKAEASAVVEMYAQKLTEATAAPLDYTEIVEDIRTAGKEIEEEAREELKKHVLEIDRIIDELYATLHGEQELVKKSIGNIDIEPTNYMNYVRFWNDRMKAISGPYGLITDKEARPVNGDVIWVNIRKK